MGFWKNYERSALDMPRKNGAVIGVTKGTVRRLRALRGPTFGTSDEQVLANILSAVELLQIGSRANGLDNARGNPADMKPDAGAN